MPFEALGCPTTAITITHTGEALPEKANHYHTFVFYIWFFLTRDDLFLITNISYLPYAFLFQPTIPWNQTCFA